MDKKDNQKNIKEKAMNPSPNCNVVPPDKPTPAPPPPKYTKKKEK